MNNPLDLGLAPSHSKVIAEKKRVSSDNNQESARKRIKMKDLDSVCKSQEMSSGALKNRQHSDHVRLSEETSHVTNLAVSLDMNTSQVELSQKAALPMSLDLNSDACVNNNSPGNGGAEQGQGRIVDCKDVPLLKKHGREYEEKCVSSGGIELDLNEEDVSSSVNQDSLCTLTNSDQLKSRRDLSECGSTTGPLDGKDALKIWTEMKQNGFFSSSQGGILFQSSLVSSSHGGIPIPKHRGRKTKNDVFKKKMEIAKKEQIDRFTKMAEPSGLLNGLNPGIINHVRNKKQVHSIIEALVRSEKDQNSHVDTKQENCVKTEAKESGTLIDSGVHPFGVSQGIGRSAIFSGGNHVGAYRIIGSESDYSMLNKTSGRHFVSHSIATINGNTLPSKLLTSSKTSDESSTFSNEDSTNGSSISYLSVKAASVASQWLELLHQDIKGRLTALKKSKKKVQSVIETDLPLLISKEFSSNQENDPLILQSSSEGLSHSTISAMHQARWTTLFYQMDKALSEEQKQLEGWLNHVREMQAHCDLGLQSFPWMLGYQQVETSENHTRIGKEDKAERELAVRAAAASIYSTCSLLMSKENVSCF